MMNTYSVGWIAHDVIPMTHGDVSISPWTTDRRPHAQRLIGFLVDRLYFVARSVIIGADDVMSGQTDHQQEDDAKDEKNVSA